MSKKKDAKKNGVTWLKYRDVSAMYDIPEGTLRWQVHAGRLPCTKIGRSTRFDEAQIKEWLGREFSEVRPRLISFSAYEASDIKAALEARLQTVGQHEKRAVAKIIDRIDRFLPRYTVTVRS